MAKRLLNLRHVPDDEADGVRRFLDSGGIGYYETRPSDRDVPDDSLTAGACAGIT